VLCGTSFLHCRREDGAPHFLGLAPATAHAQHSEYAAIAHEHDKLVNQPISRQLNRRLMDLGVGPLSLSLLDSVVELADAYMQYNSNFLLDAVRFLGHCPCQEAMASLKTF
jgi:hypothetical protein